MTNALEITASRKSLRAPFAGLPRVDIERAIGELWRRKKDGASFRDAAVEILRAELEAGRARAQALFEAGGAGTACAANLSAIEDDLIRIVHDAIAAPLSSVAASARVTIIAVGGYGRGQLAPGSDIDILFLTPTPNVPGLTKIVETLLYVLWDLKQKVGHATRDLEECLRQARADITIRTSLLEARLICGDEKLFEKFQNQFDRQIVAKTAREFVAAKLAERYARLTRVGASRYVVEPNVKEGKGGLRDLNTLFWIAKYVYRVRDPQELVGAGLFSLREYRLFQRCEEFLTAVRCHLHFVTGRAEDRLSFDLQPTVARRLGYRSRLGLTEVERFMKHYFLIAKDVGDLAAIVSAALELRQAKPAPVLNRFFGRLRRRARLVEGAADFKLENGRIDVLSPTVFAQDPVNLIRLFWAADRSNVAIHPDATRLVTQSLKLIGAPLRADHEANRLFLELLTSRNAPETVLRQMNEAGVLGRFIPEFGRIVGMMQYSMYHHFTVDEHLLQTVGVLSAIEAGRLAEDLPLVSEFLPGIANRRILYVAAFLHDIAKGRPADHSLAGAQVAQNLCPRLGLSPSECEAVVWLVEYHLIMSNMAQGRDLSDAKTAADLAAQVQTLERLKMLLVLTVCDIRAVGPGVWNGWKGQLLRTLYWETELALSGGHSAVGRIERVNTAKRALREKLPDWSDDEFAAYCARHYPAYWLKVEVARQVAHAKMLRATSVDALALTQVATDAFRGVTELTIVAPDHPRLLSIIAGACVSAGGNIVDAHIFTTTDGFALDTIFVSRGFERDEDELRRAKTIASAIEKTLRGEIRLGEIVAARRKRDARVDAFAIAPGVTLNNKLSDRYSVIEVSGLDRPGLLYDLTSALSKLNLNIASAHIVTFGEKAVDSFYITDLTGQKINAPARQATIKRDLMAIFEAP